MKYDYLFLTDCVFLSSSRYGHRLAHGSRMVWDMSFGLWSMF